MYGVSNSTFSSISELSELLNLPTEEFSTIFDYARSIRREFLKPEVYLRGLIELSNICEKSCYYCGIRKGNLDIPRFIVSDSEVEQAVRNSFNHGFGSIVIQTGERSDKDFIDRLEKILLSISSDFPKLGITLSCGEQKIETYRRWFDAGADRYLLRIESSNPKLYYSLHPDNDLHSYSRRLKCLGYLKTVGYQVGTGVMIGVPNQTCDDLAADLLFMRDLDIDMCGMGPFIEHKDTPMFNGGSSASEKLKRAAQTLRMIALLRIIMKDINIAATTALETISPEMRFLAFDIGANVIMPNLTPLDYRKKYNLYEGKKSLSGEIDLIFNSLQKGIDPFYLTLGLNKKGTSKHFLKRLTKESLC